MPNPIYQSSSDSGYSIIALSYGDCYFGSNDNDDGESDTADNDNVTIESNCINSVTVAALPA